MTGVSKNTITKMIVELGAVCSAYQDRAIRNIFARRVQADEIWSFVYARRDDDPEEKKGVFGFGDVWTWTAIDADTKLMLSWYVGRVMPSPPPRSCRTLRRVVGTESRESAIRDAEAAAGGNQFWLVDVRTKTHSRYRADGRNIF
jgi:hypothetical protein